MCGEYCGTLVKLSNGQGSSLRVRGILVARSTFYWAGRVIPACAGNMPEDMPMAYLTKGHPCVCGEYAWFLRQFLDAWGSSLRVRGI